MSRLRPTLLLVVLSLAAVACEDAADDAPSAEQAPPPPEWVEEVYPTPGADAAVPDAVEVRYSPREVDQIVRLVIDGVDVTTYADSQPGLLRYESGAGPVDLEGAPHEVEVLLTEAPPHDPTTYTVIDRWSFSYRGA